eukprot:scaffold1.g5366.t1
MEEAARPPLAAPEGAQQAAGRRLALHGLLHRSQQRAGAILLALGHSEARSALSPGHKAGATATLHLLLHGASASLPAAHPARLELEPLLAHNSSIPLRAHSTAAAAAHDAHSAAAAARGQCNIMRQELHLHRSIAAHIPARCRLELVWEPDGGAADTGRVRVQLFVQEEGGTPSMEAMAEQKQRRLDVVADAASAMARPGLAPARSTAAAAARGLQATGDGHAALPNMAAELAAAVGAAAAAAASARAAHSAKLLPALEAKCREIRKALRERKLREQQERLEALKSDDVAAYMCLTQGRKNAKIEGLLAQTDACLRSLAARLRVATHIPAAGAPDQGATAASAGGLGALAGAGTGGGSADAEALQQSHDAWARLTAAIQQSGAAAAAAQPELLEGGELHAYQLEGLRWLLGLRQHGLNGILADEMAELAAWAPSLATVAYRGSAAERAEVWARRLRRGCGFQVVLTTYECLMGKADRPRLSRLPWSYLVLDEGHRLKNAACKLNAELRHYSAASRLLLTGTPLQNSLAELWSLLNFLLPDLFDSSDDFEQWFGGAGRQQAQAAAQRAGTARRPAGGGAAADAPSTSAAAGLGCGAGGAGAGEDSEEEDEAAAEAAAEAAEAAGLTEEETLIVTSRLHQVLRPFMLRRLKASVAGELPAKVEAVVRVPPSAYQRCLFDILGRQLSGEGTGRAVKGVSNVVMEMRTVCNHPLLSRLHVPGCETALPPSHPLPAELRLCPKAEVLDRMLCMLRAGGHKVLLFCTMTRVLDVLEEYLDWRGFPLLRLDGNTSTAGTRDDDRAGRAYRGRLVAQFNGPGSQDFLFLLSIRAGGVGLNLQAADTVIMYDTDWNPQMDAQAQARAHRMGQQREVRVLRMVTEGSIEERIVGVADDKRAMADRRWCGRAGDRLSWQGIRAGPLASSCCVPCSQKTAAPSSFVVLSPYSITGGFFDGKTSAAERQRYLLDVIHAASARAAAAGCPAGEGGGAGGSGTGGDAGSTGGAEEELSDEALCRLLARDDAELELFRREAARLRAVEAASWQAALRKGKMHAGSAAAAATTAATGAGRRSAAAVAEGGAQEGSYARLAGEQETVPLAAAAWAQAAPPDADTGKEFGRGKRGRPAGGALQDPGEAELSDVGSPAASPAADMPAAAEGGRKGCSRRLAASAPAPTAEAQQVAADAAEQGPTAGPLPKRRRLRAPVAATLAAAPATAPATASEEQAAAAVAGDDSAKAAPAVHPAEGRVAEAAGMPQGEAAPRKAALPEAAAKQAWQPQQRQLRAQRRAAGVGTVTAVPPAAHPSPAKPAVGTALAEEAPQQAGPSLAGCRRRQLEAAASAGEPAGSTAGEELPEAGGGSLGAAPATACAPQPGVMAAGASAAGSLGEGPPPAGAPAAGPAGELVGALIGIRHPGKERGRPAEAWVTAFDPATRLHSIRYMADDEAEQRDLATDKHWLLKLARPAVRQAARQPGVVAGAAPAADGTQPSPAAAGPELLAAVQAPAAAAVQPAAPSRKRRRGADVVAGQALEKSQPERPRAARRQRPAPPAATAAAAAAPEPASAPVPAATPVAPGNGGGLPAPTTGAPPSASPAPGLTPARLLQAVGAASIQAARLQVMLMPPSRVRALHELATGRGGTAAADLKVLRGEMLAVLDAAGAGAES